MYTKIKAQHKLAKGELALTRCEGYKLGFEVAIWDGVVFRPTANPKDKSFDCKVTSFVSLIEAGYADEWNGMYFQSGEHLNEYVMLGKSNYLSKDGSIKKAIEFRDTHMETFYFALKDDLLIH